MWNYIVIAWNWVKAHKFETAVFLLILTAAFFCFLAGKLVMNDVHYLSGFGAIAGGMSLIFCAVCVLIVAIKDFSNGEDNG